MSRSEPRKLTPKSSIESLRREAKRWLKALRAGDAAARARLAAAYPAAPETPGLRNVQQALAREYGLAGWAALKGALADHEAARKTRAEAAEIVLRHAWDGKNGWRADAGPANRMIRLHPDIARDSMHMAAMCGELEEARRRIAADPAAASARGGPLNYEPLQYLAYGRLNLPAVSANSVEIARLLLDNGADARAMIDDGWGNPFTVLTGAIGLGEGVRPPHPQAAALAELLIARGADPFDTQALYNTSIVGDDVFWLDFLWSHSETRGRTEAWRRVEDGFRIGGRAPLNGLDYLLGNAVASSHIQRAEWLLRHGANADGVGAYSGRPHHETAQARGDVAMAQLLERHGAAPARLTGAAAFHAAVMRLDAEAAARFAAEQPSLLRSAEPLKAAAANIGAVRLLLDLGADVNAKDQEGIPPLHWTVYSGTPEVARLLIDHGAQVDVRDGKYHSTPLGWAVFLNRPEMAELLAPLSRDVFAFASGGLNARLRAVLAETPSLANALAGSMGDVTPLCCLPDDEDAAAETAALLLAAGADPKKGRREGLDAAAYARRRGLIDAADLIAEGG